MAAAVDEVVLEELKTEIERLSRELDLASTEKVQSAKYGLALLEEKSALEQRCNALEVLYENTKHELEITQEVSTRHGYSLELFGTHTVVLYHVRFHVASTVENVKKKKMRIARKIIYFVLLQNFLEQLKVK